MKDAEKNAPASVLAASNDWLGGGGEMGAAMRAFDWSTSPLGPSDRWPQSLRTIVSTCLNSRFPILVWWGPNLVKIYNDAYRQILGAKHPWALGRPGAEVWPEIWELIGPMLEGVMARGEATWSENIMLPLHRHGFDEECYFTFSYSPIREEGGGIGGIFTAVTETTGQVLSERRLRSLRDLGERINASGSLEALADATVSVLKANAADVPLSILCLASGKEDTTEIVATAGVEFPGGARLAAGLALVPGTIDISALREVFGLQSDSSTAADAGRAEVLSIVGGDGVRRGTLVMGLSSHLVLDDRYRDFIGLVAKQISAGLDNLAALAQAKLRAEALAAIDRAKTAFFSNVSHEFRTPLTLLLGPVDEAVQTLSPLEGEPLVAVQRNAQRLLKLVNTLLDFARIEAGREMASYVPTDLAALTSDLASAFRSAIERAGLRFTVVCPPLSSPIFIGCGSFATAES